MYVRNHHCSLRRLKGRSRSYDALCEEHYNVLLILAPWSRYWYSHSIDEEPGGLRGYLTFPHHDPRMGANNYHIILSHMIVYCPEGGKVCTNMSVK